MQGLLEEQITPSFNGKALQYKGSKDTAEHEGIVDRRSTWISRVMSMGPSHIKALGHFKRGALLVEARLELFTGSCYARVGVAEGKTYICLYPASTKIGHGRSWPRERCKCSFQRPWRYYRSPHFHTCDHTSRLHVLTEHGLAGWRRHCPLVVAESVWHRIRTVHFVRLFNELSP